MSVQTESFPNPIVEEQLTLDLSTPLVQEAATAPLAEAGSHTGIQDLVTLSQSQKYGTRGHRPDGKFLSNYHLDKIAEKQDLIREGFTNTGQESAENDAAELQIPHFYDKDDYSPEDYEWFEAPDELKPIDKSEAKSDVLPTDEDLRKLTGITEAQEQSMDDNASMGILPETGGPTREAIPEPEASRKEKALNAFRSFRSVMHRTTEKLKDVYSKAASNTMHAAGKTIIPATAKVGEYLNDQEKGTRRKILAFALGAGAVTLYGLNRYGVNVNVDHLQQEATQMSERWLHEAQNFVGYHANNSANVISDPTVVHLTHGDTISQEALKHLMATGNVDPTGSEMHAEVQRLMDINGYTSQTARHIPTGTALRLQ